MAAFSQLLLLVFVASLTMCTSQFELFMSERETSRLFGIDAQVYYILKDKFMTHALSSELLINSSYDDHVLSWRNRNPARPISYRLSFVTDYQDAIELPVRLNISSSGLVPTQQSALQMVFNCTGRRPAVRIELNLSLTNMSGNDDITNLSLKRKKLCSVSNSASGPSPNEFGQNFKDSLQFKASTELPGVVSPTNIRAKPTSTEIFYVAVGVASAIILLVAVIIFTLYIRTRRHTTLIVNDRPSVIGSSNHGSGLLRLDGNRNSSLMSLPSSRKGTLSSFSIPPSTSACDIQLSLAPLAINRESVHLGEVLLSGGFGNLYHGVVYVQDETEECYEQKVLIKSASETSEEQTRTMLTESCLLKGLNHQFINPVIGVCLDQPPLLVYPHSDKGNLKTLLLQSNRVTHHLPCLNTQQLVNMAIQVVKGLHYLHRKHIIHKDVATRNCCVDSNYNVKLMDYALSRDFFPDDYTCLGDNENKPVKWMAVETLVDKRYSYSTDTWSFGVLLWELITFAQQPYSDVDAFEISGYLQSGYRLLQPINCPDELFAVMAYCWAMQPRDRPSLTQMLVCLQEFHQTLNCFV